MNLYKLFIKICVILLLMKNIHSLLVKSVIFIMINFNEIKVHKVFTHTFYCFNNLLNQIYFLIVS